MLRRDFLRLAAVAPWLGARRDDSAPDALRRHRIRTITGFRHTAPRPKYVGKNSHLDDHGDRTGDDVLILETDQGATGFGSGRITPEAARKLVGLPLSDLWNRDTGSVGALGRADHALFDLVGKVLNVPAWTLLGGQGPEWVPVYDGSIYFNDLLPQYQARGVARLVEEAEQGRERGFRAFKVKVGRGFKWMEKDAGFRRDVEVIRALRKALGPEIKLMVDANNGFDLDGTLRWLDAVGPEDLYFVEEMFPEDVEQDLALREAIRAKGWKTLVADGESAREPEHFAPYLEAGVLDVLQPDIRAFGLSLQWSLSRRMAARNSPARLAPHNWGSFLGGPMQLVLARGIPNFLIAEIDWSTSDLFDASAFEVRDGRMRVPDRPGCGLVLNAEVFRRKYAGDAWTIDAA
jgi:D-galactarolactone cycloisomerase